VRRASANLSLSTLGRALAAAATAGALVSALWGASVVVPALDDWRGPYGPLTEDLRDDPVGHFLGFDDAVWEALRRSVGRGDRYAVVAAGEARFEVRNYAAYTLLPAVQVSDPGKADVVIYYGVASSDPECTAVGRDVCVVRRERP
jgi:hypothetical protein